MDMTFDKWWEILLKEFENYTGNPYHEKVPTTHHFKSYHDGLSPKQWVERYESYCNGYINFKKDA